MSSPSQWEAETRSIISDATASTGASSVPPRSTGVSTGAGSSGAFRILKHHASGGLGVVHLAYDEGLDREVALKEMRPGISDNLESRARFVREAEITAMLAHPAIVPIHARGTHPDGRPYYVMPMIRGETLKDATERLRRSEATSSEREAQLHALIRRFLPACEAVAYAHSRNVIHRDLKPANIMLGPFGETLVLDWGLAKRIGDVDTEAAAFAPSPSPDFHTGFSETLPGQAKGTLGYMSPEQARGDLDQLGPSSDIYSLGATLYYVLTGLSPFSGPDLLRLRERVIAGEFKPPREVCPETPRGLEAICLKAMANDPARRYATVEGLASDLGRWLAGQAVEARRETWTEQAERWSKGNTTTIASVGGAMAVLLVGLAIGVVVVNRARVKAENATKAEQAATGESESRRLLLERNQQRALTVSQDALDATEQMIGLVARSDQFTGPKLAPLRDQFGGIALGLAEKLIKDHPENLATKRRSITIHQLVGRMEDFAGQSEKANECYLRAAELVEELEPERGPTDPRSPHTEELWRRVALTRAEFARSHGDRNLAKALALEVIDHIESRGDTDLHIRFDLATAQNILAELSLEAGDLAEARRWTEPAVEGLEALIREQGNPFWGMAILAPIVESSAIARLEGRWTDSQARIDRAQAHLTALKNRVPAGEIAPADLTESQAQILKERGQLRAAQPASFDQGLVDLGESIAIEKQLAESSPDVPGYQSRLGLARLTRAQLLAGSSGRQAEARADALAAIVQLQRYRTMSARAEVCPLELAEAEAILARLDIAEGQNASARDHAQASRVELDRVLREMPAHPRAKTLRDEVQELVRRAGGDGPAR
jgi:serine/threonine protein kinase